MMGGSCLQSKPIPPDAKVYGLSGDDKQELFQAVGLLEGFCLILLARGFRLLTKTQWQDISLIFAFCLIILLLIVLPVYYFVKVREKTAILDSEIWLTRLFRVTQHLDLQDVTGYRKMLESQGRYAPKRRYLHLYQGLNKCALIDWLFGGEEIAAWLREHRCPPHFPGDQGPASFRVGYFLKVENGVLRRGDKECPIPYLRYEGGQLFGPDGTCFGKVNDETKNADLFAWYLAVNGFDLSGTALKRALL